MNWLGDDGRPAEGAGTEDDYLARLQQVALRYSETDVEGLFLVLALARLSTTVSTALDKHFGRFGMSHGRFIVLMHLSATENRQATPSSLADWCGVSRAAITGLINGLERDGFVERAPDPADRRGQIVRLTARTDEFLHRVVPQDRRLIPETTGQLSPQEREALAKLLARLLPMFSALAQAPPEEPPSESPPSETTPERQ